MNIIVSVIVILCATFPIMVDASGLILKKKEEEEEEVGVPFLMV